MNHERFDALAGAVMLGEASDAERAVFAVHATECDECRVDAACAPMLVAAVGRGREAETWRPSIDRAVLARIRDSRSSRFRVTIGALGWAVALSIVVNVAFVSGLSARFAGAFHPAVDAGSDVASVRIRLESPAPVLPPAMAVLAAPKVAYVPRRRKHVHRPVGVAVAAAAGVTSLPAAPVASGAAVDDVPDVLAGIDVDGTGDGAKHVAVEPRATCEPSSERTDDAHVDAQVPCPATSVDRLH